MTLKALLVGINDYAATPLLGCANDVVRLRQLLGERWALRDENLRVLADNQATRAAIEAGLRWLAQPDPGETAPVRLFHFSGHGTYAEDTSGDEPDGRDEALVPFDYLSAGAITDDVLRAQYAAFPPDTHLLLTMDCCYSGSIQRDVADDLRFRFLPNSPAERSRFDARARAARERRDAFVAAQLRDLVGQTLGDDDWQERVRAAIQAFGKKHFGIATVPGNVVLLAACRSDQTAADARFGVDYHGAFTYHLVETLRAASGNIAYGALLEEIRRQLADTGLLQVPQLECSATGRDCRFLVGAL